MSDRTIDLDLTHSTAKTVSNIPTKAEVEEYKARLARVYDRGLVIDRLQIDLPDDMHGEWCSVDSQFVTRMEVLGYKIDDTYATNRSLNDAGDGSARVGDVVFMTIPKWKKQIMDDLIRQKYIETHLRDPRRQKEEKDFQALNRSINMPVEVASQAENVTGSQIEETLQSPVSK